MASAPTQRLLAPNAAITEGTPAISHLRLDHNPEAALNAASQPVSLGPAMAWVDTSRNVVAVDFIATFPEQDASLEKANLGTLLLQTQAADGAVTQIGAPLNPADYAKAQYEASGGISEFAFAPAQLEAIQSGTLQLVQQGAAGAPALVESQFVVESDQRGTYLDEGVPGSITLNVYEKGVEPVTPVQILVAQYDTGGNLISDPSAAVVELNPASGILPVNGGVATLELSPLQPAVCYLFFYPFTGSVAPDPPATAFGSPADFFAVVRVLPFDNELEKNTPDSKLTFDFIYNKVLSTYDLIYPIMSQVSNLHSKSAVDAMAQKIKVAVSLDTFYSTLYMPITRELSAGKRKLLERYVNLLA